ncbi:MAG: hypothetical protein ACOCQD_00935 [archaeon]
MNLKELSVNHLMRKFKNADEKEQENIISELENRVEQKQPEYDNYLQKLPGKWDEPRAYVDALKKSRGPRPPEQRTRTGQFRPKFNLPGNRTVGE